MRPLYSRLALDTTPQSYRRVRPMNMTRRKWRNVPRRWWRDHSEQVGEALWIVVGFMVASGIWWVYGTTGR